MGAARHERPDERVGKVAFLDRGKSGESSVRVGLADGFVAFRVYAMHAASERGRMLHDGRGEEQKAAETRTSRESTRKRLHTCSRRPTHFAFALRLVLNTA